MDTQCAQCGTTLQRPPSRLKANPNQFCDMRCVAAYRARPVKVACAVCGVTFTVKPSRATQNNAITCSPPCLAALRQRNIIAKWDSGERRQATCAYCGQPITRKPSQLAKYPMNYCNRACKRAGMQGPKPEQVTGRWYPCEVCGDDTWRTPATIREHVLCSRQCAGRAGEPRGQRSEHVALTCEVCGTAFTVIPARAAKAKHCSRECRQTAFREALRRENARRAGIPGQPWPAEQRAKLSATLKRKYRAEWANKPITHSQRMTGEANPQWQDGRALEPYAPGFTPALKRRIRQRDGNRCRLCGAAYSRQNPLPIHHRDGGKVDHDPRNLITLCHTCHGLVHQGKLALPAP